jgi:predicted transcriptional regulator of viral defense system
VKLIRGATRTAEAPRQFFESAPQKVFRVSELKELYHAHQEEWKLPRTFQKFLNGLLDAGTLREATLKSERYRDQRRYVFGEPSPYQLALSLGKAPYLSHATAVFLHGLTDQIPRIIYANDEQSPKQSFLTPPTQATIDLAFARPHQRVSNNVYTYDGTRILLVSGKNTGRLEVGQFAAPDGAQVDVTKLERTLIDIAVRPDYGGGPYQVLEAYRAAKDRVSVNVLVATLRKLQYVYPYHQVVGFYMQRAGYDSQRLDFLRRMGLDVKFYLTYGMRDPDFDPGWQLFIPKGF